MERLVHLMDLFPELLKDNFENSNLYLYFAVASSRGARIEILIGIM